MNRILARVIFLSLPIFVALLALELQRIGKPGMFFSRKLGFQNDNKGNRAVMTALSEELTGQPIEEWLHHFEEDFSGAMLRLWTRLARNSTGPNVYLTATAAASIVTSHPTLKPLLPPRGDQDPLLVAYEKGIRNWEVRTADCLPSSDRYKPGQVRQDIERFHLSVQEAYRVGTLWQEERDSLLAATSGPLNESGMHGLFSVHDLWFPSSALEEQSMFKLWVFCEGDASLCEPWMTSWKLLHPHDLRPHCMGADLGSTEGAGSYTVEQLMIRPLLAEIDRWLVAHEGNYVGALNDASQVSLQHILEWQSFDENTPLYIPSHTLPNKDSAFHLVRGVAAYPEISRPKFQALFEHSEEMLQYCRSAIGGSTLARIRATVGAGVRSKLNWVNRIYGPKHLSASVRLLSLGNASRAAVDSVYRQQQACLLVSIITRISALLDWKNSVWLQEWVVELDAVGESMGLHLPVILYDLQRYWGRRSVPSLDSAASLHPFSVSLVCGSLIPVFRCPFLEEVVDDSEYYQQLLQDILQNTTPTAVYEVSWVQVGMGLVLFLCITAAAMFACFSWCTCFLTAAVFLFLPLLLFIMSLELTLWWMGMEVPFVL